MPPQLSRKIRVLIVDDAVVVRRIVSNVLSEDPDIEVVGVAANGKIALAKIPQVNPDILTLDIEMPEMDGLETLTEVRKDYPKLPVIMFSTLTERGATATLDALSRGATDYVTKPANVGSVNQAIAAIRDELVPKVKALCSHLVGETPPPVKPAEKALPIRKAPVIPQTKPEGTRDRVDIVAIGVSTGGPNALANLMPTFPVDFPVPIVIVQHMPEFFTKLLSDRLSQKSQIPVTEGKAGDILSPGKAWLAPGNYHMVLKQNGTKVSLQTNQDPPVNSCRPAVDILFKSVVEIYGKYVLGVILTGMGQDGLVGCQYISDAGGQIVVQDKPTSVVWGMPGFVAEAGLSNKILPLNQIGFELIRRVKRKRT